MASNGLIVQDNRRARIQPIDESLNDPNYGYEEVPGMPGFKQPTMKNFDWQTGQAPGMLNDVFNRATGGTINSFNTAANRLRERLDVATRGQQQQATNRNLGRGFGNSGLQGQDMFRLDQANLGAYSQGLGELENMFETQRQQGLQTALGAGTSMREGENLMNTVNQRDLSERRNIRNSNYQMNRKQLFEGRESSLTRNLQRMLAELEQQGANFRSSLNMGDNKLATPGPSNTGSSSLVNNAAIRRDGIMRSS
jgi:hypothetical protein